MRRDQLERDYYVIVSGTAAVHIGADHVRDLVPGEFFGELAALDWGAASATRARRRSPPARRCGCSCSRRASCAS